MNKMQHKIIYGGINIEESMIYVRNKQHWKSLGMNNEYEKKEIFVASLFQIRYEKI